MIFVLPAFADQDKTDSYSPKLLGRGIVGKNSNLVIQLFCLKLNGNGLCESAQFQATQLSHNTDKYKDFMGDPIVIFHADQLVGPIYQKGDSKKFMSALINASSEKQAPKLSKYFTNRKSKYWQNRAVVVPDSTVQKLLQVLKDKQIDTNDSMLWSTKNQIDGQKKLGLSNLGKVRFKLIKDLPLPANQKGIKMQKCILNYSSDDYNRVLQKGIYFYRNEIYSFMDHYIKFETQPLDALTCDNQPSIGELTNMISEYFEIEYYQPESLNQN